MVNLRDYMLTDARVKKFLLQNAEEVHMQLLMRFITSFTFAGWFVLGIIAWTPGVAGWPDYHSLSGMLLIFCSMLALLFVIHESIFLFLVKRELNKKSASQKPA